MQLQQLRYFIAVLDHGGFTRAAAHLGRTQQAVSKALGLLEDELGVRLLDRESGQPQATAFGRQLERFARGVLGDETALRQALQAARAARGGRVTVGAGPTAAPLVAQAVAALTQRASGPRVEVSEGVQPDLLAAVRAGTLDLAVYTRVDGSAADPALHSETLLQIDYRLVAGGGHPLALRGGACSTAELSAVEWVLGGNAGDVSAAWREAFETAGIAAPEARCTTTSVEFCRRLLAAGSHVSVLPAVLVERELRGGELVALEAPQFAWQRSLLLSCRADPAADPAANAALLALVHALHEAGGNGRIHG